MTTRPATTTNGFECRILLGPIHNWKAPDKEFHKGDISSAEQCQLCGEPLDDGKPFMTNSAGRTHCTLPVPVRGARPRSDFDRHERQHVSRRPPSLAKLLCDEHWPGEVGFVNSVKAAASAI